MRSPTATNIVVALSAFASIAFLSACDSQPHPTERDCLSSESAARYYYEAITGQSSEQVTFEPEEPMKDYAILRIHDSSGKWEGSIVIKPDDCSLVIYDTLIVE